MYLEFVLVVNAELDSMGGAIDPGAGISSTPSLHQSSDLDKTQAELRQTFSTAEIFRRELDFLQKGGDPLDLKPGNPASIGFQCTSLTDRHPEPFVTSEAKGSFAITASPHGDSVGSSGRLGAPSICEPTSADNLMLFDGDIKFHEIEKRPVHPNVGHITKESGDSSVLELPKKSYKRRNRSRPTRDGARSSSTDAVPSRGGHFLPFRHASRDFLPHDADNQERNYSLNSNSKPKSPNASIENGLDSVPAVQSTLGPAHGPNSTFLDANVLQNTQENHHNQPIRSDCQETPLTLASIEPESLRGTEQVHLIDSKRPINGFGNTEEIKSGPDDSNTLASNPTKVLDAESSCTRTSQHFDDYNDVVAEKDEKANSDVSHFNHNEDGTSKKEEGLKKFESSLRNELKNSVSTERKPNINLGPQDSNDTPFQESTLSVKQSPDVAEQNACSQKILELAIKEREDSILEEARIIESKRKRIAELSVRTLQLERRRKSQWDFVLEEMSWLANDFAQERLWKVTAAAQNSRRVAFASRVRFQQQNSLHKQKEVAHTLAEAVMQFWHMIQVKGEELESHCLKKDYAIGIQKYALRFLEYNNSQTQYNATQAPAASDSISDLGIMDLSWEDNLTEENLFYTVPPGAIEAYRKAIESHLLQFERTSTSMQEEMDRSGYDAVTDNLFEEDEGETSTHYTKTAQKRRKNFRLYGERPYEMGGDMSFMQPVERSVGTQPSVLSGKRPASSQNVSIPTKRVRTASRQRIISPFNAGMLNRTDASSGDTNSFQDEQSTLHGRSQIGNTMEAESVGDYEKQLQFDSMEVSNRPKKKKKAKHSGSMFEYRWQLDSNFQNDQKDHSRRRLDTHQFDSNGSSVASQMSNMSNPNKIMRLLVRDRGRKTKALKTPVGQPGPGSPWSLFEDQALVVLVHDMGPNWELISDAINSTLQFKCIFRKSRECKERHKILMDRNTGDGGDSAEDSGSSQPYPSTLPGIPEGSARQLFQRLQGPMEEDTLKSHFEKIIMIGQKQHYRTQNDNQDPKQLQQPHSSHAFALSQVCPNNLSGGLALTPLELAEAISSTPEVLPVGYQGPHSGALPLMNHGSITPMLPGSGTTSSAPGSSASAPLNPSVREGRYGGVPRTGPLSADDQQRIQQYNQMLSARNAQQSGLPPGSHSVSDRGVRVLPTGSGMGVMCGVNRNMKMTRPGFQGISSPSMLSSGPALSSGTATPTSASIHSGAGPSQGNTMLRPRDSVHMIRPNQNTASATSSSFPNQISQPLVHHSRPISPQQSPHLLSGNSHHFQGPPNHPAFGMRFAKERQLQQQRLLQQQQFSTSNPIMPHVQPPESQSRSSSPPVSISPMGTPSMTPISQLPQKHPVPVSPHGHQMAKLQRQRQLQQFQQRQQAPPQQQAKLMKGGRETTLSNGFLEGQSGHSSLSQPHQQKTYSGQIHAASLKQLQQQKPSSSSDNTHNQNHQKLANKKQATTAQKMLNNRKVNPSDQPTNTTVPMPRAPCNDANSSEIPAATSETFYDSSGAVSDNAATMSLPQTSGAGTEREHSVPTVNQVALRRQSSDSLPNPVGHDAGVQWQKDPPT